MYLLANSKVCSIIIGLSLLIISSLSHASSDIEISNSWARESVVDGGNSAVYFDIKNNSNQDDVLLSVSSDVAEEVEIHNTTIDNNTASMEHLDSLEIKAKSQVSLKPKSLHIMLFDLEKQLPVGSEFPLDLTFKNAGKITVNVKVMKK